MPKPPRIELKKENLEALGSAPELQDRRAAPSEHSVMTLGTTMSEIVNQFGLAPGAPDVEAEWLARGDEELKVLEARECATLIADRVSRAHPACLCTPTMCCWPVCDICKGCRSRPSALPSSPSACSRLRRSLKTSRPRQKPRVEEQEPAAVAGEEGSGEPPAENPSRLEGAGCTTNSLLR
ncbi:unnamed protein product [Symbiodinium natans]|uniref:Uncharacterized protein n=1 Tax=Symbiodinium natans TaxID=878477 RepID=A0A812JQP3_9DINO|nr:unnamed protein product [Symbiodinium natans]